MFRGWVSFGVIWRIVLSKGSISKQVSFTYYLKKLYLFLQVKIRTSYLLCEKELIAIFATDNAMTSWPLTSQLLHVAHVKRGIEVHPITCQLQSDKLIITTTNLTRSHKTHFARHIITKQWKCEQKEAYQCHYILTVNFMITICCLLKE